MAGFTKIKNSGINKGGKTEAQWVYRYKHDPEEPLTEKPKFMFKAKAVHVEKVESGTVEMEQEYQITVRDSDGNIVPSTKCKIYLSDGSTEEVTTDSNGLVILEHKIPGVVEMIEIQNEEGESELLYYANNEE